MYLRANLFHTCTTKNLTLLSSPSRTFQKLSRWCPRPFPTRRIGHVQSEHEWGEASRFDAMRMGGVEMQDNVRWKSNPGQLGERCSCSIPLLLVHFAQSSRISCLFTSTSCSRLKQKQLRHFRKHSASSLLSLPSLPPLSKPSDPNAATSSSSSSFVSATAKLLCSGRRSYTNRSNGLSVYPSLLSCACDAPKGQDIENIPSNRLLNMIRKRL